MATSLRHRGPDDDGEWTEPETGLALAFRRLAIVDLSPAGHQPMVSASGRYVIVFNGEVYNFDSIRKCLENSGRRFRGHSDTEVILEAIEEWGLDAAIRQCIGMFAIVLWDRRERRLSLIRDRLGIKPLYYGWSGRALLFGSELRALLAYPESRLEVDRTALTLYLRHGYVPAPWCILRGIRQLQPGSIVTFRESTDGFPSPQVFWSPGEAAERGLSDPFRGSEADAITELDRLLRDAVRLRMIADVPLGAFLSGGIDSSTVVALMQAQSDRPVKSFCIGFEELRFNEADHAATVAKHLGTDHTELYVSGDDARSVVPRLPEMFDEPFADSSQIPTFLVSRLARQNVTVSLSGDGGDELFAGYGGYSRALRMWQRAERVPYPVRRLLEHAITTVPPLAYDRVSGLMGNRMRAQYGGSTAHRIASILAARSGDELYYRWERDGGNPRRLINEPGNELPLSAYIEPPESITSPLDRMCLVDIAMYLPGDILTKVDRASMSVSLEARVPLLDHRVVEFALRLPPDLKWRREQGKWLLRQVLYQYVPRELVERPKMGFGPPIGIWFRGPLREWAADLLDEKRLREGGFLAPNLIRARWNEHLRGDRNWARLLWTVVMFQAWLVHWCPGDKTRSTPALVTG